MYKIVLAPFTYTTICFGYVENIFFALHVYNFLSFVCLDMFLYRSNEEAIVKTNKTCIEQEINGKSMKKSNDKSVLFLTMVFHKNAI